ncbi:MAG: hypothetical protein ABL904_05970 [Hyphomicrobiaceae bacterium]
MQRPPSRHSIGRRALLGFGILTVVTGSAATLLHGSIEPGFEVPADPDTAQRRIVLAGVSSWARHSDFGAAMADASTLLVMSGSSITGLRQSSGQKAVAGLQEPIDGARRPVLVAVSIAVGAEDGGTHDVTTLLDEALARNFDGAFLECGAAFTAALKRGPAAQVKLAAIVANLGDRVRQVNPQFIIILENAAELTVDPRVHRLIDGVSKDNLLFGLDAAGTSNSRTDIIAALHDLNRVKRSGRLVFVTEYLPMGATEIRSDALRTLRALGFVGRTAATNA